jgi:hypothetical protein
VTTEDEETVEEQVANRREFLMEHGYNPNDAEVWAFTLLDMLDIERVNGHGPLSSRPCWEFKCADPSGCIRLFDGACDACKRYYAKLMREKASEEEE